MATILVKLVGTVDCPKIIQFPGDYRAVTAQRQTMILAGGDRCHIRQI